MNDKIIGFTISARAIDHSDVDVFSRGLSRKDFQSGGCFVYLWGIGNLDKCFLAPDVISLSWPQHDSLLDRNVLISLRPEGLSVENDWLGSLPVFYNDTEMIVSTLVNKTIVPGRLAWDAAGLNDFLDCGFSVLERTPVKGVRFLRHFSRIILDRAGLRVEYKPEPFNIKDKKPSDPALVLGNIKDYVQAAESRVAGGIIIPTSGGFDSRLLNSLIKEKGRIRSFTYGLSDDQDQSDEVVKARELSKIMGSKWSRVELGDFHKFSEAWWRLFGPAVHLHGMYQIEFYDQISRQLAAGDSALLSGLIGDAWSGKFSLGPIVSADEVCQLALSHGLNSSSRASRLKDADRAKADFLLQSRAMLEDERGRVIMSMRFKLMLLNYLMAVPDYFGWPSFTPFLNLDLVSQMLNLPEAAKQDRQWQINHFAAQGIDLESKNLDFDRHNSLNFQALKKSPLDPIDAGLLTELADEKYLERLNKQYGRLLKRRQDSDIWESLARNRYIAKLLSLIGYRKPAIMKAYYEILVIKTLEYAIKKSK